LKRLLHIAPVLVGLIALLAGSIMIVGASNHDETFYACLYAGSLSQVNTSAYPGNCGRGVKVSWQGSGADGVGFNYTVQRHGNIVTSTNTLGNRAPYVSSFAECGLDEVATGGGVQTTAKNGGAMFDLYHSRGWDVASNVATIDGGQPTGWEVRARNSEIGGLSLTSVSFQAVAICTGTATP
jgi:hypothetical protein